MYNGFDMKGFSDFQAMSKDSMDAAMSGFATWTKGWQAIAAECADYTKSSLEQSAKAWEQAINAKSLEGALEAQSNFAKEAYEGYVNQAGKIGEMCLAVTRESFAPIEKQARKRS